MLSKAMLVVQYIQRRPTEAHINLIVTHTNLKYFIGSPSLLNQCLKLRTDDAE